MSDDTSDSLLPFAGVGSIAIAGGVICCMGLKLIGGAVLFGGVAAAVGLSTDTTTFVVGAVSGLVVAGLVFGHLRSGAASGS